MLKMGIIIIIIITMEGVMSLCDYTMDGLKMEQLNEGIIDLDGVHVMSIININLIILVLALKKFVDINAKIQVLEKLIKMNHRDIQIQTEEFKENQSQHYIIRLERNSPRFSNNHP